MKPGTFLCKVTAPSNGWFGESSKGVPFLRIPLLVIEDGDCEGDQTVFQGWLTDKALDRTIKNLAEVFGWDGDLEVLAKQLNTGPFVGKECQIVCENEEYNGKTHVKIKWLNPAGSSGSVMSQDSALAIAKRFAERAKAAASAPKAEAKPAPAKRPTPPADPDLDVLPDDVPFLIPFAAFIATQFLC